MKGTGQFARPARCKADDAALGLRSANSGKYVSRKGPGSPPLEMAIYIREAKSGN